jgi:hypothetical protein
VPRPSHTQRRRLAAIAIAGALTLTDCGAGTHSPRQQQERERKAAGLAHFLIVCPPDLWDRTGGPHADWRRPDEKTGLAIPAKITKRPDGLITVDLSGPNLVDLLRLLDRHAHPGWQGSDTSPLAVRLYNAIAPEVDKVGTPTIPGSATPQVVINDTVPGVPSPSATSSATPKH